MSALKGKHQTAHRDGPLNHTLWLLCITALIAFAVLVVLAWGRPQIRSHIEPEIHDELSFQTMLGFGGFGAQGVWWKPGPYHSPEFVELLINDLGLTILRDNLPLSFEPRNDNDDPYDTDLGQFNLTEPVEGADSVVAIHFEYLKAMREAGLETLIISVWSPPQWMKHNTHRGNGRTDRSNSAPPYNPTPDAFSNQLKREYYEEFAEYCVAYIRLLKQHTGLDVYAISLQNEPRFSQWYASAVYSPEALRDLIKVVGRRFRREGIATTIFAPEDVNHADQILRFIDAINADDEAQSYVASYAIHNYRSDGVQPSDAGPSAWRRTWDAAQQHDKALWMTETSGFAPDSVSSALGYANSIYNALHYGHVSAWVYWQMSESQDKGLIRDGQVLPLYIVSKHFYRFIRPGDVRLGVDSGSEDVQALAFRSSKADRRSLLLINNSDSAKQVSLEAALGKHWRGWLSSDAAAFVALQAASNSDEVTMPAKSIATFVSGSDASDLFR